MSDDRSAGSDTGGDYRVVVADDDVLVRRGVVSVLAEVDGLETIAECGSLPELLEAVEILRPDAVITDIRMPPTGTDEGIQAVEIIRRDHPSIGVVVLSQHAKAEFVTVAFQHGSDGIAYLLKENVGNIEVVGRAVREVCAGGSLVDPAVVSVLVANRSRRMSALDRLTDREREVLSLIAEGLNNGAIADRLVLSAGAVAKHINSIFSKLGLTGQDETHHRVQAVLMWLAER